MVRLPLAHAEVFRRGEGGLLLTRQAEGRNRHQCTSGHAEEVSIPFNYLIAT